MKSIKNVQNKYLVEILFTVILFFEHGKSGTMNEQCNVENNTTLICNYLPKSLPRQYEHVRILDFMRKGEYISVNSSRFKDESWANVRIIEFNNTVDGKYSLTFSRECFQGLRSLKELKIHISFLELEADAFVGLPLVHTLDVSNCYRLVVSDICNELKNKSALPGLKNLILSGIGAYNNGNNINKTDAEHLQSRNLTKVDLSQTQIKFINVTAMSETLKSLNNLNFSHSVINNMWVTNIVQRDLENLKVLDVSHSVFPTNIVPIITGMYDLVNLTGRYSDVTFKIGLRNVFTPMIINISNILHEGVSVSVHNCTLILDEPLDWKVQQLIVSKNNLKHIDLEVVCQIFKIISIRHLDLSDNGLEMIHLFKCLPNLEIINLSKNKMFKMLEKNASLFEKLFASNNKLRDIDLSNNHLPSLPKNMFKYNRNVETIDLSYNNLEQLHFDLTNLYRLRLLDVSSNMIKIFDDFSISILNGIPCVDDRCSVVMTSNPLLCSTCSCKTSIKWILSSSLVNTEQRGLLCVTEDEVLVKVDESIARKIQTLCDRKMKIIVSTVSSIVSLLTVCVIVTTVYRSKRRLRRKRNMETVISRFITGEDQYEFVAFLTYSSKDEDFVEDHVIDPLNENLKLMIGTDRNLICTGDQHLRPGFRVHDETDLCIERASVVIVIVSDNYCRSSYCRNEFDQAYLQRKPIVLMMLGNVNEELMMPTLKRLYKRDVRVLWKTENGQFVLTTSWENICSSILEKVQV